jgi:hypothetical protein
MRILFCYTAVLSIAGVTAYLIGSVIWYVLANIPAFEDEEDDTAAWDRGHDEWIDRSAGVW